MALELSIIIPCYNEQDNVDELVKRFQNLEDQLPSFEIVFVDDGSKDLTVQKIRSHANSRLAFEIRLIRLSRNFGHQLALLAGMREARGLAVVSIDADLQDPPEIIPEMVKAWKAGHEVVLGQRQDRSVDTFFKRASAKMFYKLMGKLTKSQFPPNVGDFRLVAGPALDALKELREQSPYWRGLVIWAGFKTTTVKYDRASRFAGESKYPLHKMVKLALDAVFSFSKEPLMLISLAGIATSVLSVLFILTHFVLMAAGISLVPGWMSLIALVGFLGGFQLICLGVLGQYVGRIYEQVLERPQVLYNQPEQINSNETFKKAS